MLSHNVVSLRCFIVVYPNWSNSRLWKMPSAPPVVPSLRQALLEFDLVGNEAAFENTNLLMWRGLSVVVDEVGVSAVLAAQP